MSRKVLLIGWDAAEWKVIKELIGKGMMPTLAKFLSEGASGKLATLDPPVSPILWSSIATGKRADEHGITGFTEPDPNPDSVSGVRPVTVTSRKVKAIWNILNQEGKKSNVVGWWPSHPAEPINGVMVSNFYQLVKGSDVSEWPMIDGTVHPERLAPVLSELRLHYNELTAAHILPFVPLLKKVDQENDKILFFIVNTLAHASSLHNAITYLLENEPADFNAVYYDAIDHFSHAAMKFHPPKPDHISEDKFEIYKNVVTSAYRFHDMMLEHLLANVDEETTVMIISDHGFHPDHLRPEHIPKEPSGPTYEHSTYGFFAIKGPGIKKGETIYGSSVIDICPTLLSLYGLPIGKDMKGKPLIQIYETAPELKYIDSWEKVAGDSGMHSPDSIKDVFAEQQAMNQLVELGYIEAPTEDKAKNIKNCIEESNYMLARNFMDQRDYKTAAPLLAELCVENNYEPRFAMRLFNCYLAIGQFENAKQVIQAQRNVTKDFTASLELCEGLLEMAFNNPVKASSHFNLLISKGKPSSSTYTHIAQAYYSRRMFEESESYFRKAVESDPENTYALLGLGEILQGRGEYEEAIDYYFSIIENVYFFPKAHLHIGECLEKLELPEKASEAYEIAAGISPLDAKCRRKLVHLYTHVLQQPERAKKHQAILDKLIKGEITVVTGLGRSGQSLLLSLLEAGGYPVFRDEEDNFDPQFPFFKMGHSLAKNMDADVSWLNQATDKAVRIPPKFLRNLPGKFEYKLIVPERDMVEVLKDSQADKSSNAYPFQLAEHVKQSKSNLEDWLKDYPERMILRVAYNDLLNNPEETMKRVAMFLDAELDFEAMRNFVDRDVKQPFYPH